MISASVRAVLGFVMLLVLATAASANDGIVLESYAGPRPADVSRLLSPLLDELAARGFVAGPEAVGRRFEQLGSRPAMANGLPDGFADKVESGHKAWVGADFDRAIQILRPLVDAAHASPGAFAQNQPLRDKLLKALIALALSDLRIGDRSAARNVFGEILRSFPEAQLSRATYGPEAFDAFEEVRRLAKAQGVGKLAVQVADPSAVVFINERFLGVGSVAKADLMPGEYRVFALAGKQLSRVHPVTIKANEEAKLAIDVAFDAALHTTPEWSGFTFSNVATREQQESRYAAAFANAMEARGVVVIGIDQVKGRPAMVGSLVHLMNGRDIRRASISLEPEPSVDMLKSFARFVAGDDQVPLKGIEVLVSEDAPAGPTSGNGRSMQVGGTRRDHATSSIWGGWKYVAGGASLVALGVGGYLLSVNGDCADDACSYQRDTSISGWGTVAGGVALGGISVYLFLRGSGDSSTRSAFVVPAHDGAYAGYAMKF
jgi:hypothetical protein